MNNTPDQYPTEGENNMLNEIAEAINQAFEAVIEDGVFKITPAEAGVAMFAALANQEDEAARAWAEADILVTRLESLREENARYRAQLEHASLVLEAIGYDDKAREIDELLWPVFGILEDGTEVSFEYNNTERDGAE